MTVTVEPRSRTVRRAARSARPVVPDSAITLSAPPRIDSQPGGAAGWLQYVFPIVGSLGGMLFIVNNPKPLFLASGLLFMLGSVGMGVGMGMQQRSTARRRTRGGRARYLDYLHGIRVQLQAAAAAQRAASAWSHPQPDALLAITGSTARLWERRPDDPDFLVVRVGEGRLPLVTQFQVPPEDGLAAQSDPVCAEAMAEMVRTQSTVPNQAITIDLKASPVVSVLGQRSATQDALRAVLSQLAVLHAPDDVRLLLCTRQNTAPAWDWMKWLPHLRAPSADGSGPAICDADGLDTAISTRAARARRSTAAEALGPDAWLVVLADGLSPAPDLIASLRRTPSRTTLIVIADSPEAEPGEVDVRVRVAAGELAVERADLSSGARVEGRPDRLGPAAAEAIARQLAPLRLSEEPGARRLAGPVSLTDLLDIRDVGKLDPAVIWRSRPLAESLSTPIGVSSQGDPVLLDLKESALGGDGPHGLVIGATGSGKSELLRTVVTGLALTHPPDLLAFVLVDFKGGAAFAGVGDLPHVAGVITNLADDLALVDRMHAALFGEIRRRQELLRKAGNLASLRDYHRRRAAGEDLPPLPYLVLMVDEFGELLASKPDFIDLFVAVGRLGRSLGMHLLLCSQQLDEGRLRGLEGHLSYRIALRTFSAAESRTVLGVPDAYELPPIAGSAYLKVGTTVYTRFRAALVSQPYSAPQDSTDGPPRPRPFVLSFNEPAVKAREDHETSAAGPTVLDVVVAQLRDAAPRVHQIWLPPLERTVALDQLVGEIRPTADRGLSATNWAGAGRLSVPVGLVDLPAEQSRDVLGVDLAGSAGHLLVVGAALTGKTTLLRTLIASFALTHTPQEAQFYCIDYGGGGLSVLGGLPHVGGAAGRQDPERVRRTVAEVAALLDEREARFKAAGIDSPQTLRAMRASGDLDGDGWHDVFLVIDNWPALRQDFEELEAPVQEIAARGLGYGVHLVMTASRWVDVRSALRESIGGRLELRLHDPMESAINRRAAENVAKGVPGRGMTPDSLHFQTAMPRIDGGADASGMQPALDDLVARVSATWTGSRARPVLVLPREIDLKQLSEVTPGDKGGVPIGLSERDLGVVRLDLAGADSHFLVFGDGESGKTNLLRTFLLGLMARKSPNQVQILVIDYRRTLLGVVPPDYLLGYAGAEPAAVAQSAETAQVLNKRLPPADLSIEKLRARSWWKGPDVYVVVDDYDLVVTPGGSPLQPFVPMLAQAKDVGLHVVIARRAGGAGRGVLEQLLLRIRELGTPGLLLSGDPGEGPLLGSSRCSPQPPGRGLLVRRHERPSLVQIALSAPAQ